MVSKAILQKKKCEKCFFVEDLAPYTQSAIFLGSSWIFMSRLCADFHKRYGLWNVFPTGEQYTQEEIKSFWSFSNMSYIPSCLFMSLCVSMSFFTPISITDAFFASVCTVQFRPPSPNCADPLQRSLIWDNFLTHDLNSSHDDFDDVQRVFCCCSCD